MQDNQYCPICGSKNIKSVHNELSECKECGLQFITSIKSVEYYNQIYNEGYFKGDVYKNYLEEETHRRRLFRSKIKLIGKYIPGNGSVLDVGCGMGFFLMEMQNKGYRVDGVEISEYAADIASKKLNTRIISRDLLNTSYKSKQFNIVTFWDVLEHIYDPVESLKEVLRIIRQDGVLIIETLNISSLTARVLKRKWPLYYPPYHLYYYNHRSMSRLLENTGFRIIKSFPVQTYIKSHSEYRAFRYFRYPVIRDLAGMLFDDVVIYIARPV